MARKPYLSYAEKLKDPRWQKVRLKVMERDNFACKNCSCKDRTLNVHHLWYERGAAPWEYPSEALTTLCEDCHEEIESLRLEISKDIFGYGTAGLRVILGSIKFLEGQGMGLAEYLRSLTQAKDFGKDFKEGDNGQA